MNEIKVEKIDNFKEFVEKMEVNTRYSLPECFRYKWVEFDKGIGCDKNIDFTWSMENNYAVSGVVGYVYPYKGTNLVACFKTLNGAKRNFIKQYADEFKIELDKLK